MIKITDQYFWNFVFVTFFVVLLFMASIILSTESRLAWSDLSYLDVAVIVLASWRLQRFFAYDETTKFLREQFYDLKKTTRSYSLEKPEAGPRRTILEIILSPWSFGLGMVSLVSFFYLVTEWLLYPIILLALAALVTLLELLVRRFGHPAE